MTFRVRRSVLQGLSSALEDIQQCPWPRPTRCQQPPRGRCDNQQCPQMWLGSPGSRVLSSWEEVGQPHALLYPVPVSQGTRPHTGCPQVHPEQPCRVVSANAPSAQHMGFSEFHAPCPTRKKRSVETSAGHRGPAPASLTAWLWTFSSRAFSPQSLVMLQFIYAEVFSA